MRSKSYIPPCQRYGGKARQWRVHKRIQDKFEAEMAELRRQHVEAMRPWLEQMKHQEMEARETFRCIEELENRSRWQKFIDWFDRRLY